MSWSTYFSDDFVQRIQQQQNNATSDEHESNNNNNKPNHPIKVNDFFKLALDQLEASMPSSNGGDINISQARRGATMTARVVTPLRRAICGAAGIVTPDLLDSYQRSNNNIGGGGGGGVGGGDELLKSIASTLAEGFRASAALDDKLSNVIDSIADLDDKERVCDQLRDAGDTFLVISKVPTKELRDRFVNQLGWTAADADKVSFAIYKKKRPQLPVVVVTKTKMEAAASAVDDQDVTIDISGCGLEQEDIERFAKKLGSAPLAVTSLDASANTFHRSGSESLCSMCAAAKNLRELSIAGNNIQARGAIAVIETVAKHNPSLVRLDISNNFLTTEGAQQEGLVDAVAKTNERLSWLGLAGNELCQAAGGDICAGLIQLGKIKTLVLNCNKLGSGGIARMAPAIQRDRALQHLYLEANDMRDEDVIALADSLKFHPAITSLHLRRNPLIGPLGFQALAKLVKLNPGLVLVTYDENSAQAGQTSIAQSVDFNKRKLVTIHHKMIGAGGKDVTSEGLCLWLRMMLGCADLVDHFAKVCCGSVNGESVWSVSGASLAANENLSEADRLDFFTTLETILSG